MSWVEDRFMRPEPDFEHIGVDLAEPGGDRTVYLPTPPRYIQHLGDSIGYMMHARQCGKSQRIREMKARRNM